MVSYKILWKKSTEKDVRRIHRQQTARLMDAIESLAQDPYPPQCHKLRGAERLYRIRIGDYRVIYEVDAEAKIIIVYYVRHRREAYRGL